MKPIWTRPAGEVTDADYAEFYKLTSHAHHEPLKTIPLRAEGALEYHALLFIPSEAPYDLFYHGTEWGLRLYAKEVLPVLKSWDAPAVSTAKAAAAAK